MILRIRISRKVQENNEIYKKYEKSTTYRNQRKLEKNSSRKNIPLDTPKIDEKHLRGYLERYRDYKLPFYQKSYLDIA